MAGDQAYKITTVVVVEVSRLHTLHGVNGSRLQTRRVCGASTAHVHDLMCCHSKNRALLRQLRLPRRSMNRGPAAVRGAFAFRTVRGGPRY